MSRLPRFVLPGQPQHVIQRGNNRHIIFVVEEDYQYYLSKLTEACEKHHCDIHAYVLMTNHVHLLITPYVGNGISKVMQSVGRYYVQYFNRRYQRTGTLWEGRYKATLLNSDQYFLVCSRYIELNPVRAGMVKSPEDYRWSSYRGNALNDDDPLLTNHCLYRSLGGMTKSDVEIIAHCLISISLPRRSILYEKLRTRLGFWVTIALGTK
nr:transposase [Methylomarinum sp. Ch1-1]MDP4520991.1 transposase [Methylomarinum sp. Ch1-1]